MVEVNTEWRSTVALEANMLAKRFVQRRTEATACNVALPAERIDTEPRTARVVVPVGSCA